MRECQELELPAPALLHPALGLLAQDTEDALVDTFDNIEEEEFFEVIGLIIVTKLQTLKKKIQA